MKHEPVAISTPRYLRYALHPARRDGRRSLEDGRRPSPTPSDPIADRSMDLSLAVVLTGDAVAETVVDRRTGRSWVVAVPPFQIATTALTVGQWNSVHDTYTEPSQRDMPKVEVSWLQAVEFCNEMSARDGLSPAYEITALGRPTVESRTWRPHDEPAPDDHRISWDKDASGYRLPTETEWQLACRAGSEGPRYGDLDEIAWYAGELWRLHSARRRKGTERLGLLDTLGGVWEWCWDRYDEDVYGPYRVLKGGGWSDPHWSCRVGVRSKTHPDATFDDLGLRLARTLDD